MARRNRPTELPHVELREMPLGELLAGRADYNPRVISEHDAAQLEESIREFGLVEPIVWNRRTGRVVGGHQRLGALEKIAPKEQRVQVSVVDLDDLRERVLNVKLNRTRGDWNWGKLSALIGELEQAGGDVVAGTGFTPEEVKAIERSGHALELQVKQARDALAVFKGTDESEPPAPEELDAAAPNVPIVTRRGDVWTAGPHRVACGDSMRAETRVAAIGEGPVKMVLTDPPYAIYGSSTGVGSDVTDDRIVRPFFDALLRAIGDLLPTWGHAYICCDWRTWPSIWDAAKPLGLTPKNLIVWDKGGGGLGSNYANVYELIGFLARSPKQATMRGDTPTGARQVHRPNLLRHARVLGAEREHNAAKPVELFAEFVKNSSDQGDLVLDLFMGSGTILLAAEKEKRRAAAIDVEGRWCDVALRRYQRATGVEAQLVATGENFKPCTPAPFSEVARARADAGA